MATRTWSAAADGLASVDANWSGGTKPVNGDVVIFDATSTKNCTWDLNLVHFQSYFKLDLGYSGVVTVTGDLDRSAVLVKQGTLNINGAQSGLDSIEITGGTINQNHSVVLGFAPYTTYVGNFTMSGGTFTGDATNWVTCAGDFTRSAGTITDQKLLLKLTGTSKNLTLGNMATLGQYFSGIWITGTYTASGDVDNSFVVIKVAGGAYFRLDAGSSLALTNPAMISLYAAGDTFIQNGTITGAASLIVRLYTADYSIAIGTISCPLVVEAHSGASANRILALAGSVSGAGISVISSHAANTMTLDLAGFTLACTTLTIGTRGIVTGSLDSIITGNVVLNAASAIMTQTATKSLTINGNLTLTDGTITQLGDITVSGDYLHTLGTLTGNRNYFFTVGGNVTYVAGTFNMGKLLMTGANKALTASSQVVEILHNTGTITIAESVYFYGLFNYYNACIRIAPGKSILHRILYAEAYASYTNNGTIEGPGTYGFNAYAADKTISFGINRAPLFIWLYNTAADSHKVTLGADCELGNVIVATDHASKTMTLDLAGYSITCTKIELGKYGISGILLGGEGVIRCNGTFDSSAGTFTKETSTLVMGAIGNLKLGGAKDLYNLACLGASDVTLQSDVTVSNFYAHVNPVKPGAFTLTKSRPDLEYTGLRRPFKRPNSRPYRYGIADRWIEELLAGGA